MEQNRFLKIIIVILLLINISTIAFMWTNKPAHHGRPPHRELGNYLMQELDFTSEQRQQFEVLRDAHRKLAAPWRQQNVTMHEAFYDMVSESITDTTAINEMADSIAEIQRKIEVSMFYHLKEVHAICTPEQNEKYNEVLHGAIQLMGPPPRRHK